MLTESVVAVVSGVVGAGLKALWDCFVSERMLPVERLAERLSDGRPLRRHGLARVTDLGRDRLADWRAVLDESRRTREPTPAPANGEVGVVARHPSLRSDESHCPAEFTDAHGTTLFVRASGSPRDAVVAARALCAERAPRTELLVRNHLQQSASCVRVWICAPDTELPSTTELAARIDECRTALGPWIPVGQLILEAAVPASVASESIALRPDLPVISGAGAGPPHSAAGRGTRYQLLRDRFDALIDDGLALGRVSLPDDLPIPEDVLHGRIDGETWEQLTSGEGWSSALFTGPPGAGKTELGHLVLKELVARARAIVVVIGPESRRVRDAFDRLSRAEPGERAERLRSFTSALHELAPAGLVEDELSARALGDALHAQVAARRQPIVVLVDDLHADKEMREAVTRELERRDFRFLLLGRTEPPGITDNGLLRVALEPWSIRHAVELLAAWGYARAADDDLIAEPSVYFLRMIRRNAGLQGADPATLLRGALADHLSSIETGMPPLGHAGGVPARQLEAILDMLERGRPAGEILATVTRKRAAGVVDVLGLLAWVGRFNREGLLLLVDDMVRWSDGLLDRASAEMLLDLGREARIFGRGDSTSSFWRNTFIADACAAVYCIDRRDDWPEETVAEMLLRFEATGSLGILDLALRTSERFVLIELLARARPEAIELVADLVSEDFAQRAADTDLAEHLAERLIGLARSKGLDPLRLPALSVAAARLARACESARDALRTAAARSDNGGVLAVGVELLLRPPGDEVFEELGASGVGRVFLMAASLWPSEELAILLERTTRIVDAEEHAYVGAAWSAWVARHGAGELDDLAGAIVEREGLDEGAQTRLGIPLHEALAKLRESAQGRRDELLRRWAGWIRELMAVGHGELASIVARHYAVLLDRDLSRPSIRWVVSRDGSWTIPRESFEETSVGEVLRTLEMQPAIRLPSAKELQAVRAPEVGRELVRDRLPPDYVPGKTQILPVNLGTWDGAGVDHVSIPSATPRADIARTLASQRVRWRPVVHIDEHARMPPR